MWNLLEGSVKVLIMRSKREWHKVPFFSKRPEAEIPQKEVEKVTDAVKATPCALPDTDDFLKAIAGMMRPIIHQEVKEAVGATKIKIQHEHRHDHYSYSASWSMVKDTAKKWIIGLAISTLILTVTLVAVLVHFTNSEMYLGKKYMESSPSRKRSLFSSRRTDG